MPTEPITIQMRLQYAAACLTSAADTITVLCEYFESPTLFAISATTNSLLKLVQTVKQNKDDCARFMEQSSQLLYAISAVYIGANTGESGLSPRVIAHIGNFTMTLHKIHTFVEAQQDNGRIKKFFRHAEMNTLLKNCDLGLQHAFNIFKIESVDFLKETQKIEEQAATAHQQVLDLIESSSSTEGSLSSKGYSSSFRSSTSLSTLPSEPRIFHGRESEIVDVIKQLMHEVAPRIAVLGPGGIGKTSLARTVLHHPETTSKYAQHRFFIACDATSARKELESLIGSHLGLQPGRDMGGQIIHYLVQGPPSLLILDNMETVWEPAETRKEIEELLSHLTSVEHLALMITMRGAERPTRVQWTRPFLPPLQPLTLDAAQKTFIDIADDVHDHNDIEKILNLTNNLPLAVSLIAHAVDSEGCSAVLDRWEEEKTSAISDGHDKRSNLDMSISLSLSSPRFVSVSGAKSLLSLLSILPDGLSEMDIMTTSFPIENILECKAALLRTSLAYVASANQLKVLVPVREYFQKHHPPQPELSLPLFHKYQQLLELWKENEGTAANSEFTPQIRLHLANFQSMLSFMLDQHLIPADHTQALYFGLDLNSFGRTLGHGPSPFMEKISLSLPKVATDHRLEVYFVTEYLRSYEAQEKEIADALIKQALTHMPHFIDARIQGQFYNSAANYFRHQFDLNSAMDTLRKALSLARFSRDSNQESLALASIAVIHWDLSAHTVGVEYAIDAQQAAKRSGHLRGEAYALYVQALCWTNLGNYQMAICQLKTARSLYSLCGLLGSKADVQTMFALAEVHLLKSEYIQARDLNTQILHNRNQLHLMKQDDFAFALKNIVQIDIAMGVAAQDVQSKLDSARQIFASTGLKIYLLACNHIQAELYLRDGKFASAQELFTQQLKWCWGSYNEYTIFCMERLANIGQWGSACTWLHTWPVVFLAYASKTKQKLSLYKSLQFLGEVNLAEGDINAASNLFTISLEGFTYMDVHCSRAECMLLLGGIAQTQGNLVRAEELWKAARPLFEQSSQAKQVALVDEKLAMICTSGHEQNPEDLAVLSILQAPIGITE